MKNRTNVEIKNHNKGNGICLMSKYDYLNKFNTIVNDKTELKLVKK